MKRFILISLLSILSFSAFAQYVNGLPYEDASVAEAVEPQFLSVSQTDDVPAQLIELQAKVSRDRAWFISGCTFAVIGEIVYSVGLNKINTANIYDYNQCIADCNYGLSIANTGTYVRNGGCVVAIISGIAWICHAKDVRKFKVHSDSNSIGVVYSF